MISLVAVGGLAALAGCGGGSDSSGEGELRSKIEKGFEGVAEANGADVSLDFQVSDGSGGGSGGCLRFGTDQKGPGEDDDRVQMQVLEDNCGVTEAVAEVIAIGPELWLKTSRDGAYSPARVDPKTLSELTDDQTDFHELAEAAEDISEEGSRYTFKAPASAFEDAGEVGDADVDFVAEIVGGNLRELVGTVKEGDAEATITIEYEDIDHPKPIEAPAKSEVHGAPRQIHSAPELEQLLEGLGASL